MTPRIATVRSAGRWEPSLVASVRDAASARIVARCLDPGDVEDVLPGVDGLVLGADVPWLTPQLLRRWSARVPVIGVAERTDGPGRRLLRLGGCVDVVDPSTPIERILGATARPPAPAPPQATVVSVSGPRGAPGRSEVALALGWLLAAGRPTLVAELDDAPSLAIRARLPAADDRPAADPAVGVPRHRRFGPVSVLAAPPGGTPLGAVVHHRLVEAARAAFGAVVLDAGPGPAGLSAGRPSIPLVVVDGTPVGIVRAASMLRAWPGEAPLLVVNRVESGREDIVRAVRAATGVEPDAVLPTADVDPGDPPHPEVRRALGPVAALLDGLSGRPGSSRGTGDPSTSQEAGRRRHADRPVLADG